MSTNIQPTAPSASTDTQLAAAAAIPRCTRGHAACTACKSRATRPVVRLQCPACTQRPRCTFRGAIVSVGDGSTSVVPPAQRQRSQLRAMPQFPSARPLATGCQWSRTFSLTSPAHRAAPVRRMTHSQCDALRAEYGGRFRSRPMPVLWRASLIRSGARIARLVIGIARLVIGRTS